MLINTIGIVDKRRRFSAENVTKIASAIDKQVRRDVAEYWQVSGRVIYVTDSEQIPQGVWPVELIDAPRERKRGSDIIDEGFHHTTAYHQPFANVIAMEDDNFAWTVTASHEIIEMLIDPSGNRLQTAPGIGVVNGKVVSKRGVQFDYLVEACDPCQACEYEIDGVRVSDFITPAFYLSDASDGKPYSFKNNVKHPRHVAAGGYLSWFNPEEGITQQLSDFRPGEPPVIGRVKDLPPQLSLREHVDSQTSRLSHSRRQP